MAFGWCAPSLQGLVFSSFQALGSSSGWLLGTVVAKGLSVCLAWLVAVAAFCCLTVFALHQPPPPPCVSEEL